MATDPNANGWTQYQKLVLAELERHESQMENVKKDILEIKLAQSKLSSDIGALQKSVDALASTLKDNDLAQAEKDKEALTQRIDVHDLKLKFGWFCAVIGLVTGAGGHSLFELVLRMFGGH